MKKKILIALACLLAVASVLFGIFYPDSEINSTISTVQNIIIDEIEAIDEEVVIEDITENEEISSTEETIEDASLEDEEELEIEEVTEIETFELENEDDISYDGEKAKTWNVELGNWNGLTYYSQIDSRWKNKSYTSTGNSTQTIGSSGCGPTCASMVVSSIKGEITPDTMADLFVANGYRSASNGTYWSAYRAIADEFDIGYIETSNFDKIIELLKDNYYVIASCGNGLFTTGGHYIVIVGIEGNTLQIYDPYLYDGKFNTSTRKGKVEVSGNTIYCSIDNFRSYANYKGFFCYQNTEHIENSNYKAGDKVLVNIPIKIAWQDSINSYDDSIVDSNGYQFWIKNSVIINNCVYGLATVCYDGGSTDLIQIFDRQFWCNEEYMSKPTETATTVTTTSNTVGQYKRLATKTTLYSKSDLSGTAYTYLAQTQVKIIKNVSSSVDYVYVIKTGRYAYVLTSAYK